MKARIGGLQPHPAPRSLKLCGRLWLLLLLEDLLGPWPLSCCLTRTEHHHHYADIDLLRCSRRRPRLWLSECTNSDFPRPLNVHSRESAEDLLSV